MTLGDRETRLLVALIDWPRPYPPSVRELADLTGLKIANAHGALCTLRDRGLVTWEDGCSRTIRPLVKKVPR